MIKKIKILLFIMVLVLACDPLSTASNETPPPAPTQPVLSQPKEESAPLGQNVPVPPAGQLYHAVYPGEAIADSSPLPEDGIPYEEDGLTLEDLRSYEEHVGKTAAWTYFSHNWFRDRRFPLETASWIRDTGSIPYIRLMLRSSSEQNIAETTFTLEQIINGQFDDDLRTWAKDARDFGSPLIVEYGTEVNGEWFSWNGIWNGAGTLDGYGDPAEYDGPERFRDAYRHIIQIARDEGASNITWVFHVNGDDIPDEEWNRLEQYYPGDEWIDWLGVSVYGAGDPMDDEWPQLRDGMDAVYPRLAALSPDKPIVLLEFGVTSGSPLGDQAEWAKAALTDLIALRWPRLIGFSWWNEFWENDDDPSHDTNMRIQDNPDLAAVFQKLVGEDPKVLGRISQSTSQTPTVPALNFAYETRPDGAVRLTDPPPGASDQNPAFSPNGKHIIFTRFANGYNQGPSAIYLLDLTGGEITLLTTAPDSDSVNLPGSSWNAATGRITFSSDREDSDEIWTMAVDGSDLFRATHQITTGYAIEPSFSPDGQWIVFEFDNDVPDDEQQGAIWKVRANGDELTQLTGEADDRQPNWSPAGDHILFQRHASGSDDWNLYTMLPDGSDIQQVTTSSAGDTDASWSPDGQWIVYSSDDGDLPAANIFVIPAGGGKPARITHAETRYDGAPSWSPNGRSIAFESYPGDEDAPSALWLITTLPLDAPPSSTIQNQPPDPHQVMAPAPDAETADAEGDWWQPAVNTTWQWHLEQNIAPSFEVDMYDIEMFDNDADTVANLHAQGRKVICYISVGSWEEWRPDADQFPASVIGNDYEGWPGEKWLDIRQIDVLAPIMQARLDECRAKGFDGIEPDNIDGFTNDTGFPLTYKDQLAYNIWLANEAHARGLSIGLKNDAEQVADLLPYFDWALTEDCFAEGWCEEMLPFIEAGKPVFAAEYTDMDITTDQFCPQANEMNFSAILKNRELDAWREACP